jgi:NAD(P)-dependent dehydrogenase (short-subunit alcohol dehydrogenase family)
MDPPEPEFGSLDAAAWLDVLRVNTIAPVMVTEALVPNLALGANAKVIMLSSRYGSIELNLPDSIPYCSAKAALNMVMRKIALSLKPQQITVVSFHPGWVKTDMGGQNADIAPAVSVSGMRTVIAGLSLRETGLFLDYNGKPVPW